MTLPGDIDWLQVGSLAIAAVSVLVAIAGWRRGGFKCFVVMEPVPQNYTSSRDFGVRIVVINRMSIPVRVEELGVVLRDGRKVRYNIDWVNQSSRPLIVQAHDSIRFDPDWPASADNHYVEDVAQLYVRLADRRRLRQRLGSWRALRWLFRRP